ncbi:hypothetical protein Tcan_04245 [Toxocara canis]|uniref:Uncharacterized protein n=1 Tax=Toxocara canis TaxID=6265 RepID=A0A0B2VS13_TOXCA|nr:hypothetical protein Tcan_04245 [Toxocara canis]
MIENRYQLNKDFFDLELLQVIMNTRAQGVERTSINNFMNNVTHSSARPRTKQPVYTSDKRAKFTQRENKKWIRFGTVIGYIFFVSLPAVALSIYYIYIWDPGYVTKVTFFLCVYFSIARHFSALSL